MSPIHGKTELLLTVKDHPAVTDSAIPTFVPNVQVGCTPDPDNLDLHVIRLAGVQRWRMIYDGGAPLAKSETFPPAPGQWAVGPDGWPRIAVPPVFVVTADVVGTDLPPPYVFRIDDLCGLAIDTRVKDLVAAGLLRPFPTWATTPPPDQRPPIQKLADAVDTAVAQGQFDVAGKLAEAMRSLATVAGMEAAAMAARTSQPAPVVQPKPVSAGKPRRH